MTSSLVSVMASHSSALVAGLVCLSAAAVVVPVPWLPAAAAAGEVSIGDARCNTSCGGVDIPFPFGMGLDHKCWLPGFQISCNDTGNGVFKPFMVTISESTKGEKAIMEVLSISLKEAEARVLQPIYSYCYDAVSRKMVPVPKFSRHDIDKFWHWDLGNNTPYSFSSTANKFTVVGCQTLAYITGDWQKADSAYLTGCVSTCFGGNMSLNGCSGGMGCCQMDFKPPKSLSYYQVWFYDDITNRTTQEEVAFFGPCNFAVLMDSSCYFTLPNNSSSNLTSSPEVLSAFISCKGAGGGKAPVVLDWSIGGDDCNTASRKRGHSCLSDNSSCHNATSGRGHICKCNHGFHGNPYLRNGCKDINECDEKEKHSCFGDCTNVVGSFHCRCRKGTIGNAYIQDGCQKDPFPRGTRLAVGISAGLLVALIAFLSTKLFLNKQNKKRQRYFEQHGGRMLSQILETDGNIAFQLYDRGDLVKATHGFHKANIIGEGAHGTVYKATIGAATVAVKRCKQIDKTRSEEFVRELVVVCRVNHPNVVRLLGCCLHFEAPMLVYEFVPNGTLSDLLYGRPRRPVTLPTRLRIAAETAEALAHLHSPPHRTLHGDVKPQNILLGKGYVAKVSDFGCSTINDNVQVVPKGTLAYLDPEFLQDFQITDKTDVYSFGIVLIELLTGKNPQAKEWKNLTVMFQNSLGNGTLGDLLDADIVEEGSMGLIYAVAKLVSRCIAVPGNGRPAMGQVAVELRQFSDEMPESPEARAALEVEEGSRYRYTPTVGETTTTTGFSNLPAQSTELAR